MAPPQGMIVLMGSGELTATMVEVHKEVLARLGPSPRAVFLDTPAGFQLNVDQISRKAVEYFRTRVLHPMEVASLKSAEEASGSDAGQAYQTLRRADYVLMGPGSPTYTVRTLRQTAVPEILAQRVGSGGCLVAASAAALTVGRFTLPVYEIYKVGQELHWVSGLDLLGRFGLDLCVVPHWNNAEGGTHDTRRCYMGEARFQALETILEETLPILGLDEHTALLLDLEADEAQVRGIGRVTFRTSSGEETFEKGDRVPLALLRGTPSRPSPYRSQRVETVESGEPSAAGDTFWPLVRELEDRFQTGLENGDPQRATNALLELDRTLWQAQVDLRDEGELAEARESLREMIVLLGTRLADSAPDQTACVAPVVEAFLELREELRTQSRWAEADAVRDRLRRAGVAVEDTLEGSRWCLISEAGSASDLGPRGDGK